MDSGWYHEKTSIATSTIVMADPEVSQYPSASSDVFTLKQFPDKSEWINIGALKLR